MMLFISWTRGLDLLTLGLFACSIQCITSFSASTPRVNWGVVLGGTCDDLATLEAFQGLKGGDLVAVLDPSKQGQSSVSSGCAVYNKREDFLSDGRIDAVWIGTPPGQHLYWAMHVASIRHSLPQVQNPPNYICLSRAMPGRSYEETATMAAALRARKLTLFPAPLSSLEARLSLVQAAARTHAGEIQKVQYQFALSSNDVVASWKSTADVHGGGVVVEIGPVVLRFMEMLLGPLEDVKGEALNRNSPDQDVEDYVWMQAKAGSVDVEGYWDMTRTAERFRDVLIIQGANGSLRIQGLITSAVVEIWDGDSGELLQTKDFHVSPLTCNSECLQEVTENIQRERQGTDLQGTLRLSSTVDRLLQNYYGGRGDDFFARPATWPGIPPSRRQLYLDLEANQ